MIRRMAVLVILGAATVLAAAERQQKPVFRSTIERVRLEAQVTDRGRPLPGLTAADFEVRDNGLVVRNVELVQSREPIAVAIALDRGWSAREGALQEQVAACHALVAALEPGDRAWLLTFGATFALKAGPVTDPAAIRMALQDVRPGVGSAMWDAMFGGVSLVADHPGRALVLAFTDGVDRSSWLGESRALEVLRRAEVVVSGIRPPGVLYGFNALEAAANATGGRVLYAQRGVRLDQQFVDLLDEFRSAYILSYPPTAGVVKGGWHKVDVRLKGKRGTVRVREGYFEPGR